MDDAFKYRREYNQNARIIDGNVSLNASLADGPSPKQIRQTQKKIYP